MTSENSTGNPHEATAESAAFQRGDNLDGAKGYQNYFLEKIKAIKDPYFVDVQGIDILVNPGVFPPVIDTLLLTKHVSPRLNSRILDIGTGSGVTAVLAGLKGATGIAVDINPLAIANARTNFEKHMLDIEAIQSDLYTNIPPQIFDEIYANGPYTEGFVEEDLQYAFYGARSFLQGVFEGASQYLDPNGKILLVFPLWGETEFLLEQARNNKFSIEPVDQAVSGLDRTYVLYEARKVQC